MFWEVFGQYFWACFGDVLGVVWAVFWACFGNVFGNVLGMFWDYFGGCLLSYY
jgi:hypothetical protein